LDNVYQLQQLVRVEAVAVQRRVGAVDPIAIDRAGARARQQPVPDLVGPRDQIVPCDFLPPLGIEQAQLDPLRMRGKQCEIHAFRGRGGAQRPGLAGRKRGGRGHCEGSFDPVGWAGWGVQPGPSTGHRDRPARSRRHDRPTRFHQVSRLRHRRQPWLSSKGPAEGALC
jgi:hypothetical protein